MSKINEIYRKIIGMYLETYSLYMSNEYEEI